MQEAKEAVEKIDMTQIALAEYEEINIDPVYDDEGNLVSACVAEAYLELHPVITYPQEIALTDYPALSDYMAQCSESERQYARRYWEVIEDLADSEYPNHTDFGMTLHRSLEICGVLDHYHAAVTADRKAARNLQFIVR
jgi:hypothetical protein